MTHVAIHHEAGAGKVTVDGFDLTPHLFAEPFGVKFSNDPLEPSEVYVTLAADTLDVDLPAAVLESIVVEPVKK